MIEATLSPREIIDRAIEQWKPVAIYVGFSGGNDSRLAVEWMMNNVDGCKPVHFNTEIGIEATREYVRNTSRHMGWPLVEIRAKQDCGMDYDALVMKHGFPGPNGHQFMYSRLKERGVYRLCRMAKEGHPRNAKVLIASGVRHDESIIRMGYAGREVNKVRAQIWANPMYWSSKAERDAINAASSLPRNQVADELGMSGECGCGAFAQPGELDRWRKIDPAFGRRIDRLQDRVLAAGYTWGWEGRPPKGGFNKNQGTLFQTPLCVGCEKSAIVQAEMAE